jgi:hypothetical protein
MHPKDTWPWRIPLRDRGGNVLAWALVDEADYEWASQLRWHAHHAPNGGIYAARWIGRNAAGKRIREFLHRRVLGLDASNPLQGDHRNQNRLDNRRSNLRAGTKADNAQNVPGRGIAWIKWRKRWSVQIKVRGVVHYGGFFVDENAALAKARELYAQHNPERAPNAPFRARPYDSL